MHPFHQVHPVERELGRAAPAAQAPMARYPLSISADKRRLLDSDGRPFLIQGDAAWSLIANLDHAEAVHYLDDRKAKGFNTLIVNLIEHLYSQDAPRDRAGREPFVKPGDMTTPNDAYFDAAERVLEACAARGFAVILAPAYIGYRRDRGKGVSPHLDGWYDEIVATGPEGCRKYGTYLGQRFGRFANIIWCIGGDWHPEETRAGLDAVAHGLRDAGAANLFTGHTHPEFSAAETFAGADWLDLNITYTYGIVHRLLIEDWQRRPTMPFFLIESTYEGEHNASAQQIRRQAYWSVLCGGNGHCMGNHPVWLFGEGWQAALDLPGSHAMALWGDFFRTLPWSEFVPDLERRLVSGGLGEARGLDRVTAALTRDGRVGAAYLPICRPVEVQLGTLKGPWASVEWFDPASGRRISGGTLLTKGPAVLAPPFMEDSVLVLKSTGGEDD
ncbi:apiosidase-like domain-containing protein [Taklimakanibacter deserti]|uniref:apiosidase-like domain-containing protein n=1 Tax=Taklimakanibacter deserti TaxID=2267839 RepID=UPI000E6597F3